jgi:hypothetical protein
MKKQKVSIYIDVKSDEKVDEKFHGRGIFHFTPALSKGRNAVIIEYDVNIKDLEGDIFENLENKLNVSPVKVNLEYLNKKQVAEIENECRAFMTIEIGTQERFQEYFLEPVMGHVNMILNKKFRRDLAKQLSLDAKALILHGMKTAETIYNQKKAEA